MEFTTEQLNAVSKETFTGIHIAQSSQASKQTSKGLG
jgi:hypothetical protein